MNTSTPRYHLAARYSIIAALVCFAGNCVANQIAWRQGLSSTNWFRVTVNVGTAALVLTGVLAGVYGLVAALRRKAMDSAGIAVIGLGLQFGIIALTIWGLWMVTKARRELSHAATAISRNAPDHAIPPRSIAFRPDVRTR